MHINSFSGSVGTIIFIRNHEATQDRTGATGMYRNSGSAGNIPRFTASTGIGNSSISDNLTTVTVAAQVDVTGGTGTGCSTAPIEVITTASPRVAFHWPGIVAVQIGMDAAGNIRTFDNPGTS